MKFIVNSSGTCALRLSSIEKVEIVPYSESSFRVTITSAIVGEDIFEEAGTLEAAQALALPILQALEA